MDVENWHVTGVTAAGTSHLATGEGCQDALAWRELPGGLLAAAVADGAGTARLAQIGATTAVRAAIAAVEATSLADHPSDQDLRRLLTQVLESSLSAVEDEAAAQSAAPRDLACTLIVLLAAPAWVCGAHIGDGAIIVADPSGAIRLLTAPCSGEHLNETTFVVSPDAIAGAQQVIARGKFTRISIISDGLQRLALKMPTAASAEWSAHAPFFLPLFDFVAKTPDANVRHAEIAKLLDSPRIRGRADDDLTLFLAARD